MTVDVRRRHTVILATSIEVICISSFLPSPLLLCYPVLMISKLVVLLVTCNLLVCRVSSLKLTPVQRTKHRLDIHEECEKFLSAVQNAHNKVLEDEMNVIDQRVTLDSDELKKLRLLVNRWNSIDDKLRDINALSATQNKVSQ